VRDLLWLTDAQMKRLKPFFSVLHVVPRVQDKWMLSGIILLNRNGLCRRDAPAYYDPHKTLYISDHTPTCGSFFN
jgi:transposase